MDEQATIFRIKQLSDILAALDRILRDVARLREIMAIAGYEEERDDGKR